MGVVTPAVNPEPTIESCVMATTTFPVLVSFIVWVVGVFSACVPKPRLVGVAEMLAEEGTGVGLGEGVAPGVPAVACPPPPQPIALIMQMSKTRRPL